MKSTIIGASLLLFLLASCKNKTQKEAQQYHDQIKSVVDDFKKPTSKDGLYASAEVNGKEWIAKKMLVDMDDSHPVVQAYNQSNEVIVFYLSTLMEKGKPFEFKGSGRNAAQYNDKEDALSMWDSEKGERTITKMDDNWIEGSFQFTAVNKEKSNKAEITNGFFRIPKPKEFHLKEAE